MRDLDDRDDQYKTLLNEKLRMEDGSFVKACNKLDIL